jgi:uncharacterized protein (DUF2236 family)
MAQQMESSRGLFAPDSVTRRIYSQSAVLLGWPRAILMQLAHPLVAAGVAQHSSYQVEPLQRLLHTFDAALHIVFGTRHQAESAAERINAIHERVCGRLEESVGRWEAGTPYRAGNPDLLLWVHCTLVESDTIAYERIVEPLSRQDKERCYKERKVVGPLLGLREDRMPASFAEMQRYLEDEIESDRIEIGEFQRNLGERLLRPAIKGVPKKSYEPLVGFTAGLLPEKLRLGYGLEMTRVRRAASRFLPVVVRRALPLMPGSLRSYPAVRAKSISKPA